MKTNNSYTFIVNYDGGTYVSQIFNYINIQESIHHWFDKFIADNIKIIRNDEIQILKKRINSEDYNPILLEGMKNVWCNDLGVINKSYFSMTIVGNGNSTD